MYRYSTFLALNNERYFRGGARTVLRTHTHIWNTQGMYLSEVGRGAFRRAPFNEITKQNKTKCFEILTPLTRVSTTH